MMIDVKSMINAVARAYNITTEQLRDHKNCRDARVVAVRRSLLRYLVFGEGMSVTMAARALEYSDRTSVQHMIYGSKAGFNDAAMQKYVVPVAEEHGISADCLLQTDFRNDCVMTARSEVTARMVSDGYTPTQIAVVFDVDRTTIERYLLLHERRMENSRVAA